MIIRELTRPEEIEEGYQILKELRTDLPLYRFRQLLEHAKHENRYVFLGGFDGARLVAIMGYRVLIDFVHGRHLYIDDLVVSESERSKGLGASLLQHAEKLARDLGCEGLRLCAGVQNKDAHRFYERNGWLPRALAFKKKRAD